MDKMYQNTDYIKIKEKSDKAKNIEANNIKLLNTYTVSLFIPINNDNLKLIKIPNIYPSNISFLFPNDNSYKQ